VKRREFITLLGGAAAGWPPAAHAQRAGKVWRIGVLSAAAHDGTAAEYIQAFRRGLAELGYSEGAHYILDPKWADGRIDRLPALVSELLGSNVDLIVTTSAVATLAASEGSGSIAIVQLGGGSPVRSGIAGALSRPGGNVTGRTNQSEDLGGKLVELLLTIVPKASKVGVLFVPDAPVTAAQMREIEDAARLLRVTAVRAEVRTGGELEAAFGQLARDEVNGLIVPSAALLTSYSRRIAELAAEARLPAVYPYRHFIVDGGLISYGVDQRDAYRQGARFIDRLMKGHRPADMPIEQPTKFELVVNLKTAKALGLDIPPTLLARADEVIE
jgi:putative ABC transport system substrate-binding protein